MATEPQEPAQHERRRRMPSWLITAGVLILGVFVVGILGFTTGTLLEDHDSFCTTCHTIPETTYVSRAGAAIVNTTAVISDLATDHYHATQVKGVSFSCIQCHRGDSSLGDRAHTLTLAARDTLIFISGKARTDIERPTIDQPILVNTACVACHETTLLTVKGNQTHQHNMLPQTATLMAQGRKLITTSNFGRNRRIEQVDVALVCTDCHLAHKSVDTSTPQLKFIDKATAQIACDTCHKAAGERPETIDRFLRGERD